MDILTFFRLEYRDAPLNPLENHQCKNYRNKTSLVVFIIYNVICQSICFNYVNLMPNYEIFFENLNT